MVADIDPLTGEKKKRKKKGKRKGLDVNIVDLKEGDNSTNNIVRYEFTEALVRIALARYGSDNRAAAAARKKKEREEEEQSENSPDNNGDNSRRKWAPVEKSPMQAVERLIESHVLPLAERLRLGPNNPINEWRDARLYRQEVHRAFSARETDLRKLFVARTSDHRHLHMKTDEFLKV